MTTVAHEKARVGSRDHQQELALHSDVQPMGSSLPFAIFLLYTVSFYLHFGERFPFLGPFRPDVILAALVSLTLIPGLKGKANLLRTPVAQALNVLVIVIILSLPFVEWPGSVIRNNLQPFIKAILFFYFTILAVDSPRRLRTFVFVFVACQLFRVLEPLYLNLTEGYLGSRTHLSGGAFAGRLSGAPSDVINPNGLGFVIATTTIFIHFLLWQSKRALAKTVYLALLPAMLYTLVLTMSRGGFIALLVGGWLIFRQSKQKVVLLLVAIGIAIGGWSAMSDVQRDRYLSLVSSESQQSSTAQGRLHGMVRELELGLNRPIFGHGLGTTPEARAHIHGSMQASHNLYTEVLVELGIVGIAVFGLFMFRIHALVKRNINLLREAEQQGREAQFNLRLANALLVVFWVYAVYSVNYFGLSQAYWYALAGLCVSFSVALDRSKFRIAHGPYDPRAAKI